MLKALLVRCLERTNNFIKAIGEICGDVVVIRIHQEELMSCV